LLHFLGGIDVLLSLATLFVLRGGHAGGLSYFCVSCLPELFLCSVGINRAIYFVLRLIVTLEDEENFLTIELQRSSLGLKHL
jgi:hypothetical protein